MDDLIKKAQAIITPGDLTYGNARRMLDILNRYRISKILTKKQEEELRELIKKAKAPNINEKNINAFYDPK